MVIACQKCNTRFHLDDARVPRKGVRVRCSRCKHAFFVQPPGAGSDDTLHGIAAEAASSPLAAPEPAAELDDPGPPGLGEEEESDWQFNDEPGTEALEASALGDLAVDSADALDPMAQTLPPSPLGEASREEPEPDPNAVTQAPEDLFGDGISIDAAPELELPDAIGPEDSDGTEVGIAETAVLDSDSELFGAAEPLDVPNRAAPETAPPEARAAPIEESDATEVDALGALGSPEEWDLLGEGGAELAEDPAPAPAAAAPERAPLAPPAPRVEAEAVPRASADPSPAPAQLAPAAPRRSGRFDGITSAAGLACVAALFCIGLVRAAPEPVPAVALLPSQVVVGGLEVREIGTRTLENAQAGPILVVGGTVRPVEGHRAGEWLRVVLLDAEGNAVTDGQPAGPVLGERALRERDPRVLGEEQERAAAALARAPAAGAVAFQAVFESVPAEAVGVGFEGADPPRAAPGFVGPPAPTGSRRGLPSSPE